MKYCELLAFVEFWKLQSLYSCWAIRWCMTAMQKPCTEIALVSQVILFSIATIIPQCPRIVLCVSTVLGGKKSPFLRYCKEMFSVRFATNFDAVANDSRLQYSSLFKTHAPSWSPLVFCFCLGRDWSSLNVNYSKVSYRESPPFACNHQTEPTNHWPILKIQICLKNILHIGGFIFSQSALGHAIGIGIFCMNSPGSMPDHEPFQGVMSTCVPSFSPGWDGSCRSTTKSAGVVLIEKWFALSNSIDLL